MKNASERYWAHRGLPLIAPENTLASFRAAAQAGAKWIETDLDICEDGTLLICHDETLDRTTNQSGPAASVTAETLPQIDAGSWFASKYVGEPMPTLAQIVDLCLETGLNLNLEIKPTQRGAKAARELVIGACRELKRFDDPKRVIISSFNPMLLSLCAEEAPEFERACLFTEEGLLLGWKTVCELASASAIHPDAQALNAGLVKAFKEAGLRVHPYTVNEPAKANQLFNWGVDAVFTDRADWFISNQ
ncbi:glycerophosphoryl diester phosphodiesterase [Actinomycetaceae bacterium TAE3-ERU4]|nr:glycerophosphoryl diester phosphodiesterase [Actinomycetaceae bacterium TAE3-ERU4]